MDVHRTPFGEPVRLGVAIVDQVAAILIPLGVVLALTRAWSSVPDNRAGAATSLVFPALMSFVCVVPGYTLLVFGIRRSTGARGYALARQSLAAFFLAEIAGKLLLVELR